MMSLSQLCRRLLWFPKLNKLVFTAQLLDLYHRIPGREFISYWWDSRESFRTSEHFRQLSLNLDQAYFPITKGCVALASSLNLILILLLNLTFDLFGHPVTVHIFSAIE